MTPEEFEIEIGELLSQYPNLPEQCIRSILAHGTGCDPGIDLGRGATPLCEHWDPKIRAAGYAVLKILEEPPFSV